ncbi:NYN domain-containing protein [Candidatus Gottesmanbacteria bacterium]|nr:NYN domain-containing protein [Candidatus Gottesmanbacteria bacterium]
MKKKTFFFIDGSNLYSGQFDLFGPDKYLDFSLFIDLIETKLDIHFDKIYFYASYSPQPKRPTKKQKEYLKNEAFFYKSVKNTKNVAFFTGYRSKVSGKEKEVDVKLAVDVIDFAHRNYYQQIFLMSGDADFMEALFAVRRLNKKIIVLCLENKTMFKSFAFFGVYIITFKHMPKFKKLTRTMRQNLHLLKMEEKQVIKSIR